jgi:hypothetical protein
MKTQIALRYVGPTVEAGNMDVYSAAANMVAFSEFVVAAAKATFGETVVARAQVAGFARGSFSTDLVFDLAGLAATIYSAGSIRDLLQTLKEAIDLWRHLKGSPPAKVAHHEQIVTITNNSGQIIQVSTPSVNLVFSAKAAEAAEQFVGRALERPGMDAVEFSSTGTEIARITQAESGYFVSVAPSETVTDTIVRMVLVIEAPVFKEGNKWRFSDGQQSFHAEIEDREFLARVDAGERFGKGDILAADVRINQQQVGMKLSAERTIVRVYEHKQGSLQLSAF